jgi:putative sterol carrier protein
MVRKLVQRRAADKPDLVLAAPADIWDKFFTKKQELG